MNNFNFYTLLFIVVFSYEMMSASTTHAQVAKGKMLVGGALSYQNGGTIEFAGQEFENFGSDFDVFAFAPRVGYAVSDGFVVGGRLALAFGTEEQGSIEVNVNAFGIAPFARYYMPLNEKAYIFGEGLINFGSIGLQQDDTDIFSASLFQIGINPGFAYFISDKVSVEFMVNLISFVSINEEGADEADNVLNFGPNFDLNGPSLAIQFFF